MQRKVIQLAGKTLVISLPSKWVKKQNIKKGEELEICESDSSLTIRPLSCKIPEACKTCLDVSGLNSSLIWHYLVSAYIKGIDEIELRFSEPEIFSPRTKTKINTIQYVAETTDTLIGMELVRHSTNFCIIKEVSSVKLEEFNTVLKRLFFNVCSFSSDVFSAVQQKNWQVLENCAYVEQNVNKLFAFCSRALNKGVCEKTKDSFAYYLLVAHLEQIADAFNSVTNAFIEEKPDKLNKDIIFVFDKINALLHKLYELFYDFDKFKCTAFYDNCRDLKEKILPIIKNTKPANLFTLFTTVQEKCMDLLSARIMLAI